MKETSQALKVACPVCRKPSVWNPNNRWRPFCSERCRMIDLGEWLDEGYQINDPESPGRPFSRDPD